MALLKVALVQARSHGADPDFALREGERACRQAARRGADLVLFPELWQIGYASCPAEPGQRAAWLAHATTLDGPFVSHFRALARELGLAIVITYLEEWAGAPRNTATLIDRHGEPVLTHAKVHTCDFGMEAALTPGDGFRVADLDTRAGTVRVGLMICYDREFPESARVLMLGGAEIILTPNACGLEADRLGQFRARAYENVVGVAMANYATPDPTDDHEHLQPLDICNGHSVAFSGIKFDRAGNALDHKLVEAGEGEELPIATFDLDALRAYRAHEPGGDAYRKPALYRALSNDTPLIDWTPYAPLSQPPNAGVCSFCGHRQGPDRLVVMAAGGEAGICEACVDSHARFFARRRAQR